MARLPRLTLPDHLHHVLQRGNNGQTVFKDREDYEAMLGLLADNAQQYAVVIHAYALLANQFHLLATPTTADGLQRMMQAVGRRYVPYFNRRHGRTGTLWEGRYRSALMQPERYLIPCMVYFDWSPVRAGQVAQPGDYPWSSHAHWLGLRHDRLLTPHAQYWALGNTPFAREAAYAARVQAGLAPSEEAVLSSSVAGGWALGDDEFVQTLQKHTPRRVIPARPGRPPLQKKT